MSYFTHCTTLEELKSEFKRLAFENHPDRGGDTATMQQINAEYSRMFDLLKDKHRNANGEMYTASTPTDEAPEEFIEIISRLIRIPKIVVELCGSWLWVSGNTKPAKDTLKELHFSWSANKSAWYYHHGAYFKRGKKKTLDEIRIMYGSQVFNAEPVRDENLIPA